MTKRLRRRNDGGETSECHSSNSKRQHVPCISEEEEEEIQIVPRERPEVVVLSDDSDSEEEETLGHFIRSRKISPKSLTLPSSDLLDCPTCYNPLKKPIFQCCNGHLVCSSCCSNLRKKCVFCKLPNGEIRCRAMEKLVKSCLVSCPNAKYGCKQSTTYGKEEENHQKLCAFAPCSCPIPGCTYVGYYRDLKNHFRVTHERSPAIIMSFELGRPMIFGLDHSDDPVVFQEKKKGDLVVVQGFKGSSGVYASVRRVAPMVPTLRRFSCSLAHLKACSTLRLHFLVKNVQNARKEEKQPEDSFLLIPSHMLSGDHLKMQICIDHQYPL